MNDTKVDADGKWEQMGGAWALVEPSQDWLDVRSTEKRASDAARQAVADAEAAAQAAKDVLYANAIAAIDADAGISDAVKSAIKKVLDLGGK